MRTRAGPRAVPLNGATSSTVVCLPREQIMASWVPPGEGQRASLVVDLRVHDRRLVDRVPDKEEASTRERNGADVAAAEPVRVAPAPRLILRAVQGHAPNGQVDTFLHTLRQLGAVVAVDEVRTIGGDVRVKGPVVQLDVARIVLGDALEDMAVEIEEVEIAEMHASGNRDQLGMVGRQCWLRPVPGGPDLGEVAGIQLEHSPVLDDEHRSGERELWLRHRRLYGPFLDHLAFQGAEVKVNPRAEGQHDREEEDGGDPAKDHGKFSFVTARICDQ